MVNYCEKADIDDGVLKGLITDKHIEDTNLEIESIVKNLGVAVADIANPVPYELKKVAVAYTHKEIARSNSNNSVGNAFDSGYDSEDVYSKKYKQYLADFDTRKKALTPEIVKGTADDRSERVATINIWRT